jgi:CRP-like cAMP-binding protein
MPVKMLVKLNQQPTKIFVVVQGRLELFQLNDRNEEIVAVCGPGMYTGELNVLSGRRALVSIRAAEAGELIEIEREALRTLVQTDSQLSDIFLRAAGGQAGQFKDRKLSRFPYWHFRTRTGRKRLHAGAKVRRAVVDRQAR